MAAKRFENPLLSNARLKEMYAALVETRALSHRLRSTRSRRVKGFVTGMEAAWVGSAIGLRDVNGCLASSDDAAGPALDVLLGEPVRSALRGNSAGARLDGTGLGALERAWSTLGAAQRMQGQNTVALLYLGVSELSATQWKLLLGHAQRTQAPLLVIAIPGKGDEPGVAELSSRTGVPGIPVDANDAVAMYRVAQESIGRARAGGGPALIEAVCFPRSADPVALLRRQLLAKGVASERWIEATGEKLERQIAGLRA